MSRTSCPCARFDHFGEIVPLEDARQPEQLGFAVAAVPALASTAGSVLKSIGNLLGLGGDKDPAANAQIDQWAALYRQTGDPTYLAMIRCMSKVGTPSDQQLLVSAPPQPPASGSMPWNPPDCFSHGWASVDAQKYGQQVIAQLTGQVPSTNVRAAPLPVGQLNLPQAIAGVSPGVLVAGAALIYLLSSRRRGR